MCCRAARPCGCSTLCSPFFVLFQKKAGIRKSWRMGERSFSHGRGCVFTFSTHTSYSSLFSKKKCAGKNGSAKPRAGSIWLSTSRRTRVHILSAHARLPPPVLRTHTLENSCCGPYVRHTVLRAHTCADLCSSHSCVCVYIYIYFEFLKRGMSVCR